MNYVSSPQFEYQVAQTLEICIENMSLVLQDSPNPTDKNWQSLVRLFCATLKTRDNWIDRMNQSSPDDLETPDSQSSSRVHETQSTETSASTENRDESNPNYRHQTVKSKLHKKNGKPHGHKTINASLQTFPAPNTFNTFNLPDPSVPPIQPPQKVNPLLLNP